MTTNEFNVEKVYIPCLGVDGKWHICEPHSNTCKCGVKVKTKKVGHMDRSEHYSCYECTY